MKKELMKNKKEYLNYEIFRISDNKVVERGKIKLHSWTQNFYNLLAKMLGYVGTTPIVNTSGTTVNFSYGAYINCIVNADETVDEYGVVVGDGDTAESLSDYKLASKIANGDTDGYLHYDATTSLKNDDSNKLTVTVSRVFYNYGSTDITIKEIGVIEKHSSNTPYLVFRSVLSSPLTVSDGYGIKMNIATDVNKS